MACGIKRLVLVNKRSKENKSHEITRERDREKTAAMTGFGFLPFSSLFQFNSFCDMHKTTYAYGKYPALECCATYVIVEIILCRTQYKICRSRRAVLLDSGKLRLRMFALFSPVIHVSHKKGRERTENRTRTRSLLVEPSNIRERRASTRSHQERKITSRQPSCINLA
jgi:hypothetical protein